MGEELELDRLEHEHLRRRRHQRESQRDGVMDEEEE